jgi:hypothetical protein
LTDEFGKDLKEVVIPCWYLLERTEENHKMPQDNQSPGQDLNRGPPEYKSRSLLPDKPVHCGAV